MHKPIFIGDFAPSACLTVGRWIKKKQFLNGTVETVRLGVANRSGADHHRVVERPEQLWRTRMPRAIAEVDQGPQGSDVIGDDAER